VSEYDISIDAIQIINTNKFPITTLSPERLIEQKNKQRQEIDSQVAEYLAKGGAIQSIPIGQRNFVEQFDPSAKRRKKQASASQGHA